MAPEQAEGKKNVGPAADIKILFPKSSPRLTQPWHTSFFPCATAVSAVEPRYQSTSGTDSYALDAILYEMLTGRPPFHAPTF